MHFHVINVKHVGSRGISGQIRRRLDLQRNQVHVLHCFVGIRSWDRVLTSTEIRDGRTVPKEHVLYQSLLLQRHQAVQQNDVNVSSFHTQQDTFV